MTAGVESAAKRLRRAAVLMTGSFVLMAFLVGTFVVAPALQRDDPRFDPFRLPDQTVLSRVSGVIGPAAHDGFVSVQGTKCNDSAMPVHVVSERSWQTAEPPGIIIGLPKGKGVLPVGCITQTFLDPIPPEVVIFNDRLLTRGLHPKWFVTALLTPEGAHVVPRAWRTEPFRIMP